jgi:hypothetical protein
MKYVSGTIHKILMQVNKIYKKEEFSLKLH